MCILNEVLFVLNVKQETGCDLLHLQLTVLGLDHLRKAVLLTNKLTLLYNMRFPIITH